MDRRLEVLETAWMHSTHYSILAELSQLRDGLRSVLDFGSLIDNHPSLVYQLLSTEHRPPPLNADSLLDLFTPTYVGERGSNQRALEENIMHNFSRMLEDCDNGLLNFSCSDILIFTTGVSSVPPLGFSPLLTISFTAAEGLPTASTCANVLRIPTKLQDYDDFKGAFDLAIRGCQGFGPV